MGLLWPLHLFLALQHWPKYLWMPKSMYKSSFTYSINTQNRCKRPFLSIWVEYIFTFVIRKDWGNIFGRQIKKWALLWKLWNDFETKYQLKSLQYLFQGFCCLPGHTIPSFLGAEGPCFRQACRWWRKTCSFKNYFHLVGFLRRLLLLLCHWRYSDNQTDPNSIFLNIDFVLIFILWYLILVCFDENTTTTCRTMENFSRQP